MGIFYSYCKECNKCISWFLNREDIICRNCNTINTEDDRINSLFKEEYWTKERLKKLRKAKLNKLNERTDNNSV